MIKLTSPPAPQCRLKYQGIPSTAAPEQVASRSMHGGDHCQVNIQAPRPAGNVMACMACLRRSAHGLRLRGLSSKPTRKRCVRVAMHQRASARSRAGAGREVTR